MSDTNDSTHGALPEQGANGAVAKVISLETLEATLGKDFGGDPETALKSIKDTFAYIGKRKEDIAKEIVPPQNNEELLALKSRLDSLEAERFYEENPTLKEFRPLLQKIGGNPAEAIKSPELAPLLEKARAAGEFEKNRSVIHSKPRIANPTTQLQEAQELAQKGASKDDLADALAKAIIGGGAIK